MTAPSVRGERWPVAWPAGLMCVAVLVTGAAAPAVAQQQVTIGTPQRNVGDRFYESTNVGWSLRGNGWFARFGGGGTPPFGGYQPGAGISGGAGFGGSGFSGNLFFNSGQGSSRSLTSSTPMVTTLNGYPGYFIEGVQRPFVTGLVPVGAIGGVTGIPPQFRLPVPTLRDQLTAARLQAAMERSRSRHRGEGGGEVVPAGGEAGEVSSRETVAGGSRAGGGSGARIDPLPPTRAERARLQAAAEAAEQTAARNYYDRGLQARAEGKTGVARQFFRMAARRATGDLREQIAEQLGELPRR